jgi:hypothetical protein
MNRIITSVFALMVMVTAVPVFADEDRPSADLSVSALSQYIWRGQELSRDSIVIQPSATFAYKGFSANIWANYDTNLHDSIEELDSLTETDYTMAYDYSLGMVSGSVGYIYYALDQALDSQELFVSAGLDILFAPTLTVYREFSHYPSTYITLEVSHSIPLAREICLDFSLLGSALFSDDEAAYPDPDDADDEYSGLHHGEASLSLSIPASSFIASKDARYFTITPEIHWIFPISGDGSNDMSNRALVNSDNNFVYGGVTVSFSF